MGKFTILTAKKALALAYPDIEFTYGKAGRGRRHGHAISWVGGPPAEAIRRAAGAPSFRYGGSSVYHFIRQDTPEEREVKDAQWEAERRAYVAAEPARRAAAKAAGIEKRKATAAAKKANLATLAKAFPGVEFTLTKDCTAWTDGPEPAEVAAALGERYVMDWRYQRHLSPEFQASAAARKAAQLVLNRQQRRLAESKVRALCVAKGIERRRQVAMRIERESRQLVLPMDFPVWERPPVYIAFR